ncbi:acetyl-coenzyme A synthetase N-terminal domain-containing protein, partial [Pseudoprimorskyibacter insulae]|uniref:acetyl-coenzyme A synthetase N-terminal domain-containing protein n=1 Tax=Pseudoprimorskyibacter insulae TaxID=1695997 RepID=UPI002481EF12
MSENTYPPSPETVSHALIDAATYDAMYASSIADPAAFWGEQGKRIDWIKPYTQVKDVDFTLGQVKINWFADGTLNVAANCVDRHLETRGDQTA